MLDNLESILLKLYENINNGNQWDEAVDELQRLMCYREVKAYSMGYDEYHNELSFEQFIQDASKVFVRDYSEKTVLSAINKVKSEYA